MSLRCLACLTVNPDTNRFCGNCGATFGHSAQELPASTGAASPDAQWGALKHATILFADVVSSTEHVAGLDPEQAMEQLRPALQQMCNAVERFGGTVVRTLGDGVMALFGAPRALEGHASLACEAALAMQAAFSGAGKGLRIRVGMHSGQVALDPGLIDATRGGGVHGHSVHLASRVVAMAEPGGICITADCLALVRAACDVRPIGSHVLKGIAEPVELHILMRMKSDVQSQPFHEAALSPFRGRDRELDVLRKALDLAEIGQGSVIGLSGAPGTGKSRLCHEFGIASHERQVPVSEVRTQLYGHATPLQPVLTLLRTCFFRVAAMDDAVTARGHISRVLERLRSVSPDDLALMNEFLGVADVDAVPCSLNAKARRARLLGLLHDLVKSAGKTHSVIVFEDLHWLDEASGEFLSVLVDAVAGTRTLLLLNYRPGYQAPWSTWPHFRALHLADLGVLDTEALVRELLDPYPGLQSFFPLVVERSAGNPFFAEELVHSLVEKNALIGSSGNRKTDIAFLAQTLPATVQAVIGERIDRLVATQRTLLHICAVIGKEIPLAVLQEVAVYLVSQLETGLDGLCEAELLQLLREIAGGRRFAFRHPLIQEVAYNTQLRARRANLHAAVAIAMEAHYSAQPGEFSALVAYHYAAAGQFVNAAQHEARAAKWTGSTNSAQAIKHWRKVWALLDGQERSPEVNSLRALAGGRIVYLGWREGLSPDEVQQIIQEAIGHASEVDNRLVQLLLFAQGRILQSGGGGADEYVQCVLRALSLTPPGTDRGRVAMLNVALSQAYAWAGLLEQGLSANDAAMQDVASIDKFDREFIDFSIEQWVLGIRVRLLIRMNRLDEARDCLHLMLNADEGLNDPVIGQIAHHLSVELASCSRNAVLAHEHSAMVSKIAQEHRSPYSRVFALWCNGVAQVTRDDLESAHQSYSEALQMVLDTRVAVEFETEIQAGIAERHYRAEKLDEALAVAKAAVALSRHRNNRLTECRALIVWGGVLSRSPDSVSWLEAEAIFEQAGELILLTGGRVYEQSLVEERHQLAQKMAG